MPLWSFRFRRWKRLDNWSRRNSYTFVSLEMMETCQRIPWQDIAFSVVIPIEWLLSFLTSQMPTTGAIENLKLRAERIPCLSGGFCRGQRVSCGGSFSLPFFDSAKVLLARSGKTCPAPLKVRVWCPLECSKNLILNSAFNSPEQRCIVAICSVVIFADWNKNCFPSHWLKCLQKAKSKIYKMEKNGLWFSKMELEDTTKIRSKISLALLGWWKIIIPIKYWWKN